MNPVVSEKDLRRIKRWPYTDGLEELMAFVKDHWAYADWGWTYDKRQRQYDISTGGWSDNEAVIGALMKNRVFWSLCWQSSRRGGHYQFILPEIKKHDPKPKRGTESTPK